MDWDMLFNILFFFDVNIGKKGERASRCVESNAHVK